MKVKFVPIIMMLSVGLIDCILGIYYRLGMYKFLIQLLIVLVIFYVIGDVIRFLWIRFMGTMEDESSVSEKLNHAENPEESVGETGEDAFRESMENIESEGIQE